MLAQIRLNNVAFEVILLSRAEFFAHDGGLYTKPVFSDAYTFDAYIDEKRNTEDRLRDALEKKWTPNEDFEVGDDENIAFTLCGGIYTPRVVCRDYLEILWNVLESTPMRDRWAYATAVEITVPDPEVVRYSSFGGFILQGNRITVNLDRMGFDFVACFSRSREDAETGRLSG